ncbi:MAG: hypothetical protein ACRDO2_14755 [Nocardioidaceae bacterium]
MSDEPKTRLSFPQIIAGALAAASAAIASSWLGVAGTVIGAAVVSVVASIGSVLYTRPIERSHERLLAVATARGTTHRDARGGTAGTATTSTMVLPAVEDDPDPRRLTEHDLGTSSGAGHGAGGGERPPLHDRLARRWRTVAVSALAMLVGGLVILTSVELLANGASSVTGVGDDRRPTLMRLFDGGDNGSSGGGDKSPAPAGTNRTSTEPTDSGSTSEPAETPQPTEPTSVEPTETQPTETAPTEQPTETQPTETAPTSSVATTQPAPADTTP